MFFFVEKSLKFNKNCNNFNEKSSNKSKYQIGEPSLSLNVKLITKFLHIFSKNEENLVKNYVKFVKSNEIQSTLPITLIFFNSL